MQLRWLLTTSSWQTWSASGCRCVFGSSCKSHIQGLPALTSAPGGDRVGRALSRCLYVGLRLQAAEAAAAAAPPPPGSMRIEDLGQPPPGSGDAPGDDATIDDIQDYFLKRQQVLSSPDRLDLHICRPLAAASGTATV